MSVNEIIVDVANVVPVTAQQFNSLSGSSGGAITNITNTDSNLSLTRIGTVERINFSDSIMINNTIGLNEGLSMTGSQIQGSAIDETVNVAIPYLNCTQHLQAGVANISGYNMPESLGNTNDVIVYTSGNNSAWSNEVNLSQAVVATFNATNSTLGTTEATIGYQTTIANGLNVDVINIGTTASMADFLPTKGTSSQVLGSDGAGNFNWVTVSEEGGIVGLTNTDGNISISSPSGGIITLNLENSITLSGTVEAEVLEVKNGSYTASFTCDSGTNQFDTNNSININSGAVFLNELGTVACTNLNAVNIEVNGAYTFPTAKGSDNQVLGVNGSGSFEFINVPATAGVTSLAGTSNQISVSASTGAVTVSLPSTVDVTSLVVSTSLEANGLTYPTSGTAGYVLTYPNSGTDLIFSAPTTGTVSAIGTLDSQTPNANGAVISGSDLYFQSASASDAGLMNTGPQTFAGAKAFDGLVTFSAQDPSYGSLVINYGSTYELGATQVLVYPDGVAQQVDFTGGVQLQYNNNPVFNVVNLSCDSVNDNQLDLSGAVQLTSGTNTVLLSADGSNNNQLDLTGDLCLINGSKNVLLSADATNSGQLDVHGGIQLNNSSNNVLLTADSSTNNQLDLTGNLQFANGSYKALLNCDSAQNQLDITGYVGLKTGSNKVAINCDASTNGQLDVPSLQVSGYVLPTSTGSAGNYLSYGTPCTWASVGQQTVNTSVTFTFGATNTFGAQLYVYQIASIAFVTLSFAGATSVTCDNDANSFSTTSPLPNSIVASTTAISFMTIQAVVGNVDLSAQLTTNGSGTILITLVNLLFTSGTVYDFTGGAVNVNVSGSYQLA